MYNLLRSCFGDIASEIFDYLGHYNIVDLEDSDKKWILITSYDGDLDFPQARIDLIGNLETLNEYVSKTFGPVDLRKIIGEAELNLDSDVIASLIEYKRESTKDKSHINPEPLVVLHGRYLLTYSVVAGDIIIFESDNLEKIKGIKNKKIIERNSSLNYTLCYDILL